LAYSIIDRHGATYWFIASLSSMLIPAIVIGFFVFEKKIDAWIILFVIYHFLLLAIAGRLRTSKVAT
jgi:hypothetical protein